MRTSAHTLRTNSLKPKNSLNENFDEEYERLSNLCDNKKNFRGKEIIKYFIKQKKREYLEEKMKQKQIMQDNYKKIFKNFLNLENSIRRSNNHEIKIINKKKGIKDEKKEKEKNDISNGSIENKNLQKKFYLGCLDVKWILSKNINSENNLNIPVSEKKNI